MRVNATYFSPIIDISDDSTTERMVAVAHRTKKRTPERRGKTFVGLRPIIEASKKERLRRAERKHKTKQDFE